MRFVAKLAVISCLLAYRRKTRRADRKIEAAECHEGQRSVIKIAQGFLQVDQESICIGNLVLERLDSVLKVDHAAPAGPEGA